MTFATLRHRWIPIVLFALPVAISGCPRVLYLDYHPSTTAHGTGAVRVDNFLYAGHPTGLMKQKELQSGSKDPEALYLSQDIGLFFTNALKSELAHAGYTLDPASGRTISGNIEEFFLDYVGEHDQRFRIRAGFSVAGTDGRPYESACHSDHRQTKDWMRSGVLIEHGIRDCIEEFLQHAQAAGAL